ncbi:MAG: GTP cyclohydrolase I FolE2 [Bdellovibrionaceae bacterium]|nr:GTP cyclohydrolase I FolE2 [Pseudobdellovibrionaceae bacterium]MDW8190159.1 GTP cyclohydrolase, FolE2/MptA family [Pseudobdellovibrionaceae bacterium]
MHLLPDLQSSMTEKEACILPWVGLERVFLPVRLTQKDVSQLAMFSVGVNLASRYQRGIHMSRLYQVLEDFVTKRALLDPIVGYFDLHKKILESHVGLSDAAEIMCHGYFSWEDQTLKSGLKTMRSFPVTVGVLGSLENSFFHLIFQICYSSTCPQSFALSEAIIQSHLRTSVDGWKQRNKQDTLMVDGALVATPHSQRSLGWIKLVWERTQLTSWLADRSLVTWQEFVLILVKAIENEIVTVSQNTVKREDEAEFAKLNAQNPMFCEDAARRIAGVLKKMQVPQFHGEVVHYESLHPFNVRAAFGSE